MKILLALVLGLATASAWTGLKTENSLQLQVNPGQALRLELSSGDYRIEPGANDQIRVISRKNSQQPDEKPRFGLDSNAREACVKVNAPQNYSAVIQVPKNSTLKVRLNGGRLQVNGISGDKDIESHAGAVSIAVGAPENYARVDASVNVGHIEAQPFGASEEGSVRSFLREGPGRYRLHAHVDSGDITMF
jgi:hypothetical protein